ncbi:MAG: hypothetical protein IKJ73_08520 [Lachnospiraceae bacterium]|nr:hypothetical protein [Lachnospiraceae bacterium]
MNNKTKKLIASIVTIIIFVIGGYFYLAASDEDSSGAGEGVGYESQDNYKNEDYGVDEEASNVEESTAQTTESTTVETDPEDTEMIAEESTTDDEAQLVETTYQFRKQQNLDDHFAKHGSEFDYETAEEYLAGANRVINDPNSLYKTEAEDGDHIYYLESTNEFVVVSTDGYIRTYFRPSAGIDYFNRQ